MKIITIGDLHGRNCWKNTDFSSYDKVIFVGDYTDSFYYSNVEILANLNDVVSFKKENPDKVELLLGNHDIQYLEYPNFRCEGFRPEAYPDLTILFRENKNAFQIAFQIENYLWTHAGVSNKWYNRYLNIISKITEDFPDSTLADVLNIISQTSNNYILHEIGAIRGGLGDNYGGVTWADKTETENDFLNGYHQIVGHTPVPEIIAKGKGKSSITYVDCLQEKEDYYIFSI